MVLIEDKKPRGDLPGPVQPRDGFNGAEARDSFPRVGPGPGS
jgi:hypothetical protein